MIVRSSLLFRVSFQLVLLVSSLFSFSYLLGLASVPLEGAVGGVSLSSRVGLFDAFALAFVEKFRSPLIPLVSAQGSSPTLGCCEVDDTGALCSVADASSCNGEFVPNVLCESVSFCQTGCCYDASTGEFSPNTLLSQCSLPNQWDPDATCVSVPGSGLGCCLYNDRGDMMTQRQCEVATRTYEGEGASMDWQSSYNAVQCAVASRSGVRGACETGGGSCVFNTARQCLDLGGTFNEGFLCTSEGLDSSCEPTQQTRCDGEAVHFVDSCGNLANIYDASRVNDPSYWNQVIFSGDSCGASDMDGNAGSRECGNCNKQRGGMCSSAVADNVDLVYGDYYCAQSYCEFKGEQYRDGESWCVYDGAIGGGDDVVGSRHWLYVCSQGSVQIEACTDARQEICTQSTLELPDGYDLKQASCKPNNWRNCLALNNVETQAELDENLERCESEVHCRVEQVNIADKFSFEVCAPKYPAGVDFRSEVSQANNERTCGIATRTCTVVKKGGFFGGCSIVANEDCLSETFAQEMNDLCRGVGDCGGEVNIAGDFVKNYNVVNAPDLSDDWIADLKGLSQPVLGQFAETETNANLEGLIGSLINPGTGGVEGEDTYQTLSSLSMGLGLVGTAAGLGLLGGAAATSTTYLGILTVSSPATGAVAWSGPLMGAAIGAYAGLALSQELELSPFGAILMTTGGAAAGAAIGAWIAGSATLLAIPIIGWIIFALVLIIASLFFVGGSCDSIEVQFTCESWQPPSGGDNCDVCNGDPLKPCSRYRCESLGAACEYLNDFEHNGLCVEVNPDDVTPPVVSSWPSAFASGVSVSGESDSGFTVSGSNSGGCVDPVPLGFGIRTDEAARCRISPNLSASFSSMQSFGLPLYQFNHSARIPIPDPSHGQAMGLNWSGEMEFLVRCQDAHGNENPYPYVIDMCVRQGDDNLPTSVEAFSPRSGSSVSFGRAEQYVELYTYELATCKWDVDGSKSYDAMDFSMGCADELFHPSSPAGYMCNATLPLALNDSQNTFYFKCSDQPWLAGTPDESKRNVNVDPFVYVLSKPSSRISIDSISPNTDFTVESPIASFDISVQTSGGADFHLCEFSFVNFDETTPMLVTGVSSSHSQPNINLVPGNYNLYVMCRDETGDSVQQLSSFEIFRDTVTPVVTRVSQSGGSISFETSESAECRYSTDTCSFLWGDADPAGTGLSHSFSSVRGQTYFIRCQDGFGNAPSGCSLQVQAV